MITNAELEHLNRLVGDELKVGRSPAQVLDPLHRVLENSIISANDLAFGTGQSKEALPGHILACNDASTLSTHVSNVYPLLSGCGEHYNGMYGSCEMLRDKTAAAFIQEGTRPPASIAEQVVLCLRVLGTSQVSLMPDLAVAIRRHLSSIMLKYPVLMHPSLLVPVMRAGNREYVSLASALSQTAHGALPRYSHFRSREENKVAGADEDLAAQLTAFAKHPCVRLMFGRAAHRVRVDHAGLTARDRQVKMGKESLLRSLLGVTGPRVEFLASVMELDELAGTPVNSLVRPFWASAHGEEHLLAQLDAMLAASISAASGLVHVAAMQGTIPASMRAHAPDTNFLLSIRKRREHLFNPVPVESGVGKALLKSAQRRIFLGRQDSLSPAELAHNVRNLALGLTFIGFCGSAQDAGEFLLESCVGEFRPDGNLPRADASCAIAFLKAINKLGGMGSMDEAVVTTAERVKASATAENRPFSDSWAKASEVFGMERVMLSVINRASTEAKFSAPAATEGTDSAPARRRARAAV